MIEFIFCMLLGAMLYGAVMAIEQSLAWAAAAAHRYKVWRAERLLRKKQRRNEKLRQLARRDAELERRRLAIHTEAEQRKRAGALAIKLHVALKQIPLARDFRRPAAIAGLCREVPLVLRQSLYNRYKGVIEEHAAACLQQRINRKLLTDSLADLLQALGIARFEAEYIIEAAAQKLKEEIPPRRNSDFGRLLQEELLLHRQRVKAIESLKDQPETIEQMLEIEHRRHEEALIRLTVGRRRDNGPVTTL